MSDPFVNPNEAEALASEVARISKLELLFAPERETLADAADTIRAFYRLLALCRDTPRAEDEERIGELEAALDALDALDALKADGKTCDCGTINHES